jgi:hypothetical protein
VKAKDAALAARPKDIAPHLFYTRTRELPAHADSQTTKRIYRRGPE